MAAEQVQLLSLPEEGTGSQLRNADNQPGPSFQAMPPSALLCLSHGHAAEVLRKLGHDSEDRERAVQVLKHTEPEERTAADIDVLERLLRGSNYFGPLDVKMRREVCRTMMWRTYAPLTPIIWQGDEADECFVLLKGTASIWVTIERRRTRLGSTINAEGRFSVDPPEDPGRTSTAEVGTPGTGDAEEPTAETRRKFVSFMTEPSLAGEDAGSGSRGREIDPETQGPEGSRLVKVFSEGECFGESGLLHGDKRSATIVACEVCELGVLQKNAFDRILRAHFQREEERLEAFLRKHLPRTQTGVDYSHRVARFFSQHSASRGTELCRPGRPCNRLLVIREGACKVFRPRASGPPQELCELGVGHSIGASSVVLGVAERFSIVCTSFRVELLSVEPIEVKVRLPYDLRKALAEAERQRLARLDARALVPELPQAPEPPEDLDEPGDVDWINSPFLRYKRETLLRDSSKLALKMALHGVRGAAAAAAEAAARPAVTQESTADAPFLQLALACAVGVQAKALGQCGPPPRRRFLALEPGPAESPRPGRAQTAASGKGSSLQVSSPRAAAAPAASPKRGAVQPARAATPSMSVPRGSVVMGNVSPRRLAESPVLLSQLSHSAKPSWPLADHGRAPLLGSGALPMLVMSLPMTSTKYQEARIWPPTEEMPLTLRDLHDWDSLDSPNIEGGPPRQLGCPSLRVSVPTSPSSSPIGKRLTHPLVQPFPQVQERAGCAPLGLHDPPQRARPRSAGEMLAAPTQPREPWRCCNSVDEDGMYFSEEPRGTWGSNTSQDTEDAARRTEQSIGPVVVAEPRCLQVCMDSPGQLALPVPDTESSSPSAGLGAPGLCDAGPPALFACLQGAGLPQQAKQLRDRLTPQRNPPPPSQARPQTALARRRCTGADTAAAVVRAAPAQRSVAWRSR